jgi:hypothetical protein
MSLPSFLSAQLPQRSSSGTLMSSKYNNANKIGKRRRSIENAKKFKSTSASSWSIMVSSSSASSLVLSFSLSCYSEHFKSTDSGSSRSSLAHSLCPHAHRPHSRLAELVRHFRSSLITPAQALCLLDPCHHSGDPGPLHRTEDLFPPRSYSSSEANVPLGNS